MTAPAHDTRRPGRAGAVVTGLTVKNLRSVVRTPISLIMSLAYPVAMYVLFALVFRDPLPSGITYATYSLPAMVVIGLFSNCLFNLSIDVTSERQQGLLKRLALLPCPASAYLVAKIISAAVLATVCTLVLLLTGALVLSVPLPTSLAAWGLIVVTSLLTTAYCAAIGIAVGRTLGSAQATLGVVLPVFMVVPFVSGIFLPLSLLPGWLVTAASVLPLRWSAQLLRHGFLPDSMAAVEPSGGWQTGTGLAVVCAWVVIGVVWAVVATRRDTFDR